MVFKLVQSAAKRWRLLNGSALLPDIMSGVVFPDSIRTNQAAAYITPPSTTRDNISIREID